MKKFIIIHFGLVMLCAVLYAHTPRQTLEEIRDTLKNLTAQPPNIQVRMIHGKIPCGIHFFCHAEKSLKTTGNITSLRTLCRRLKQYNNETNHTTCRDIRQSDPQVPVSTLLEQIQECTKQALANHTHVEPRVTKPNRLK